MQVRMSQDSTENGYFLAALNSFVTRTCYANAGGEHSHCTLCQHPTSVTLWTSVTSIHSICPQPHADIL